MYNGIGLTTPRGSGTNGYVIRNLSHLRVRDPVSERAADFDRGGPSLREPDQGILEHERKRKIEVRCLELQAELEEKNLPEDEIDAQVDALRKKLYDNLASVTLPTGKALKSSDTHGIALAKKAELSKMASALKTSSNYVEGQAFDREKQEELKKQRAQERAARDAQREEAAAQREVNRLKYEAEKKERERLRRRREYEERLRREAAPSRDRPPSPRGGGGRRRSPSPDARRRRDMSISPPPPRRRYADSRSPSPPPRRRRDSRSISPELRRRRDSPSRSRSRTPPRRYRDSPPRSRRMSDSPPRRRRSRSFSPDRNTRRSRSPPPRRPRSPSTDSRGRARSDDNMSVSSGSSGRRSRSRD